MQIDEIMESMRLSATHYYALTGKPIGITGELGEYDAIRILNMKWAAVRQAGYDAEKEDGTKVQIKTRSVGDKASGRLGAIKLSHDWDSVMLVIMDRSYSTQAIYEADRATIENAINRLQSKARNSGKLSITEFKKISKKIWQT
jgi:hypothetical protein